MEDFSRDIRQKVKSYPQHKPIRQSQKWTLLFSTAAASGGLYFLYDLQVKKSKGIEHDVEELKKQVATVRQEKNRVNIYFG